MDLARLRSAIDDADRKLLRLIDDRMQLALRAGRLKPVVEDPAREEEVLRNVNAARDTLLDAPFIEALFRAIMEESRRLQDRRFRLVAFQGERGAWGELAARSYGASLVPMPCREFRDVFQGVADGAMDVGLVPVENSIEGAVGEVNDLLVETNLRIVGEVLQPIHHALLALPGTDRRDIRAVYSHPQALGQCRGFLSRLGLEARPFYDTAGAARWLANDRPQSVAVLASTLSASLYGLDVVEERVEDHAANTTRFLALARDGTGSVGRKCSLVFSAPHRAGALLDVLRVFAEEQLNLTRIESRPVRSDPGAFAFLLDFLGARDDEHVVRALGRIPELTLTWKVLGFYEPAASANGL
ncbi:MAG TPA: prephenate dehydratase [Vicinamibacterales bacterium]|jgi:prephenate dehydratase/chorismate mutase/prephenate dehydratase